MITEGSGEIHLPISEHQMLEKLRRHSTPTVANVVANIPNNPYCLRIYDNEKGAWYTDQSVRCVYPELGSRIGYAFTLVAAEANPSYPSLSYQEIIESLSNTKKPIILVTQQIFAAEKLNRMGLWGGQTTALFKACGVVGVVTNGPSRDLDEIRTLGVQYVMSGTCPAHGNLGKRAVNVPVSIAGMDVVPGIDIIHMDEHGAIKFPADRLADIYNNIDALVEEEKAVSDSLSSAKTVEEIKKAWR